LSKAGSEKKTGWFSRLLGKKDVAEDAPVVLPSVVIVADLFDEGHEITVRFRALGMEPHLCVGGEEAIGRLQGESPALLYLDCWESRMDGLALLRLASHYHPDLPARVIARVPGGGASAQGRDLVSLGVRTIAPKSLSIAALAEGIEQATGTAVDPVLLAEAHAKYPHDQGDNEEGDLQIGAEIDGRFGVLGILGRGSSSTVYEVIDANSGADSTFDEETVALKLLLPNAPGDDPAGALLREFEVTAGIDHPNVVRGHERGTHEGMAYITLDVVRGASLEHWIEQQETLPPVAETFKLLAGGARGLEAMHAGGMVHRDVKPGNLLVDETSGRLTLIDFGATLLPDSPEHEAPGPIVGTPMYVCPERLQGETAGTSRSDIFSLGVVLYETLTGRLPFRGTTVHQLLRRIAEAPPVAPIKINPDIPQPLSDAILRMLSKRPELRPVNIGDVLEALADGREPPSAAVDPTLNGSEDVVAALLSFGDDSFESFEPEPPDALIAADEESEKP
jgi:CheY-like chemotaxis protein